VRTWKGKRTTTVRWKWKELLQFPSLHGQDYCATACRICKNDCEMVDPSDKP
jgi:hypothetical protein